MRQMTVAFSFSPSSLSALQAYLPDLFTYLGTYRNA